MGKLFIWGAGEIGKRVQNHLSDDWEIVFVDSNKELVGGSYCGKRVISVEDYLERHSDELILIAHLQENESIHILKTNNIGGYFIHCNLPGEFKEPYARDNLKRYIVNYLKNRTDYVLYGLDLYSIIIDEWLYEEFGIHPHILIQDSIEKELLEKIVKQYPQLSITDSISQSKNIKEVCVCLNDISEIKKCNLFDGYQVTDVFDCTEWIKEYYNPEIEKFYNIHEGDQCFIVATGPSLKIEDLDRLKKEKEICFSMNSIFHAFSMTEWRPDYYVMSDYRGYREYKGMLDDLSIEEKFLSDNNKEFWQSTHENNVHFYHQHYEYCFDKLPKFSEDFSKKSYASSTVTYTCLQLAVYMGFKKIYLLGVDFSYGDSTKNISYTHFYSERKAEGIGIGYVSNVTLAYQSARQYADSHEIKIYNATRGGKLEIFERIDFDSLFD